MHFGGIQQNQERRADGNADDQPAAVDQHLKPEGGHQLVERHAKTLTSTNRGAAALRTLENT
jgi:hypothetical protein